MNRWVNKIAVVTGASSGIGAAIVKDLAQANITVVGLARRVEKVEAIRSSLPKNLQSHLHPVKCDVSNEMEVQKTFEWIVKTLGGVDIMINNAGILKEGNLSTMDSKLVRDVINTNIMGIIYCTKEAFKSMQSRNKAGHVILVNSILGHRVLNLGPQAPSFNIYPPTKFAVTAITDIYRQEFSNMGTNVKITSLSPGLVETEIVPDELLKSNLPILKSEDISNAVMFVLSTPPHVQISELTIQHVLEKF